MRSALGRVPKPSQSRHLVNASWVLCAEAYHGEAVGLGALEEDEVIGRGEHHVASLEMERHGGDGG